MKKCLRPCTHLYQHEAKPSRQPELMHRLCWVDDGAYYSAEVLVESRASSGVQDFVQNGAAWQS